MLKKKLTTLTIKPAMLELTRQQQRQVEKDDQGGHL